MVRRGDIVIAVFGGALGNKPRPALVVQDTRFETPVTVLAIPFTSGLETASNIRPIFEPDSANGLIERSCLMSDKISPVRREMIGSIAGRLADRDLMRVEIAMQIILGMFRKSGPT